MAAPPPEVTAALLERTEGMRGNLLQRLARFVRNILAIVRDADDDSAVPAAVEQIVDAVEQGRRQVTDLTELYVETVLAVEGRSRPVPRPAVEPDRDDLVEQWTDLVERHLQAIDEEVLQEAEKILREDLDATQRGATRTSVATGYRRVIHPEMSRGGTCGLCVAAAHRIYSKPNLKPIHDGCHCTVLPVTDDYDPGKDLNDADLEKAYGAAGTTDGWTLKQARFKTDDDGNLEAVQQRKQRGPRKAQGDDAREYDTATGLAEKSAEWLRSQLATTEALKPSDWRDKQLARLRAELAKR